MLTCSLSTLRIKLTFKLYTSLWCYASINACTMRSRRLCLRWDKRMHKRMYLWTSLNSYLPFKPVSSVDGPWMDGNTSRLWHRRLSLYIAAALGLRECKGSKMRAQSTKPERAKRPCDAAELLVIFIFAIPLDAWHGISRTLHDSANMNCM